MSKRRVSKLTLFSPAKINLYLYVKSRRDDGFHNLETWMQAVDFGDTLTFELADSDQLTSSDPSLPCDASNFVHQAVNLFRQESDLAFSIKIHIEKKIPQQRGLGGGSSNVATTLFALNKLHGFPISKKKLLLLAAQISSDAPFFFSNGSAICRAKGEELEESDQKVDGPLYLINPPFGLSTKEVFQKLDMSTCGGNTNDLEYPATLIEPRLKEVKQELLGKFERVWMTGSGSAFVCSHPKHAPEGVCIRPIVKTTNWY